MRKMLDPQLRAPISREPRQGVTGGDRERERNHHDQDTDEGSVQEPLAVERFVKQPMDMFEGRPFVE